MDLGLEGLFDLHIHGGPDVRPRKLTCTEVVQRAKQAGMAGVLLKCHASPTAILASNLDQVIGGIHVFGCLCLNYEVGGLNPEAVRAAIAMGAKEIWMPTFSGESFRIYHGKPGTGIRITDNQGNLFPVVEEILAEIAKAGVILGTGHVLQEEILPLVKRAREVGVQKVLVTHPDIYFLRFPLSLQLELNRFNVFFERCAVPRKRPTMESELEEMGHNIRKVGCDRNILTTDYGQPDNPYPAEGLLSFMEALNSRGISEKELDVML
jgi:ABC-type branched-subunit amino acid transport system substrate-binding protein